MGGSDTSYYAYTKKQRLERFWARVHKLASGCWEWMGCRDKAGYGQVRFAGKARRAHRVAWFLTKGPIPKGLCVLHKCDNPPCVNPEHLWLGTRPENSHDMTLKGRQAVGDRNAARLYPERRPRGDRHGLHLHPECAAKGERNGTAKLTEAAVLTIRRRYAKEDVSTYSLAVEFGMSRTAIDFIVRGETWKHVGGPVTKGRTKCRTEKEVQTHVV